VGLKSDCLSVVAQMLYEGHIYIYIYIGELFGVVIATGCFMLVCVRQGASFAAASRVVGLS